MKEENGFTLVELLAVIAILAILVIIALPNVMGMFNSAKKNSFITELKEIYKTAQQEYINDSMFNQSEQIYARCNSGKCSNELDLSGRSELEYFIKFNNSGNVIEYYATDGTYQYSYLGDGLLITDIVDVDQVAKLNVGVVSINCETPYVDGKSVIKIVKFDSGKKVNEKIKKLVGSYSWSSKEFSKDSKIKSIIRSNTPPTEENMKSQNIISSSDSSENIYVWFENENLYYF